MNTRKKKRTKLLALMLVLIMLISIGYAALSTQLTINGDALVKAKSWNVHFANIVTNSNNSVASVVTAPTLSNNNTTVTWEVSMDTPGQMYEFNVDVVNEGTIDAMVQTATNSIVTSTLTAAQQEYLDYTIKYVNGADIEQYDKLAAGETKTITVKLLFKQDIDPEDLPQTAQSGISLSYTTNYVQADGNAVTKVTEVASLAIGDSVNYSTTLNGVTLDDWSVFYVDGDYTYIILDDYLPNAAIDTNQTYFNKLSKNGNYSIYVDENESGTYLENRTYLINALSIKSNWDSLLIGTINGKAVNEIRNEHVFAMGTPDIELWKNIWNLTFSEDTLYTKYEDNIVLGNITYDGWYIGDTVDPSDNSIGLREKGGYNNTLYYPHKESVDNSNCNGYWICSPSSSSYVDVIFVDCDGSICPACYIYDIATARPVISLPTSIVNQ